MNNAEKFQEVFGYYATEMWAKTEAEFLDWINEEHNERTGEWVNSKGEPVNDRFSVYCSRCKAWSEYRDIYCGNCGAKMGDDTE